MSGDRSDRTSIIRHRASTGYFIMYEDYRDVATHYTEKKHSGKLAAFWRVLEVKTNKREELNEALKETALKEGRTSPKTSLWIEVPYSEFERLSQETFHRSSFQVADVLSEQLGFSKSRNLKRPRVPGDPESPKEDYKEYLLVRENLNAALDGKDLPIPPGSPEFEQYGYSAPRVIFNTPLPKITGGVKNNSTPTKNNSTPPVKNNTGAVKNSRINISNKENSIKDKDKERENPAEPDTEPELPVSDSLSLSENNSEKPSLLEETLTEEEEEFYLGETIHALPAIQIPPPAFPLPIATGTPSPAIPSEQGKGRVTYQGNGEESARGEREQEQNQQGDSRRGYRNEQVSQPERERKQQIIALVACELGVQVKVSRVWEKANFLLDFSDEELIAIIGRMKNLPYWKQRAQMGRGLTFEDVAAQADKEWQYVQQGNILPPEKERLPVGAGARNKRYMSGEDLVEWMGQTMTLDQANAQGYRDGFGIYG